MAETFPNPIPIYVSGDASKSGLSFSSYISSSANAGDGSDAILVYTLADPFIFGLLQHVTIYSRGTNGAGKAILWVDDANAGNRSPYAQLSWNSTDRGLVRLSGAIVYMDIAGMHPDGERMRGRIIRDTTNLYIQIEDASMTDGYDVYCDVRNLTIIPGLADVD